MDIADYEFEDDKVYVYIPMYDPGIYEKRVVMTKEIFVECWKRWIAPKGDNNEGHIYRVR